MSRRFPVASGIEVTPEMEAAFKRFFVPLLDPVYPVLEIQSDWVREDEPHEFGGPHTMIYFPNGFSVSIIKGWYSRDIWEIALGHPHAICYMTESDVIRFRDEAKMQQYINRAAKLPENPNCPHGELDHFDSLRIRTKIEKELRSALRTNGDKTRWTRLQKVLALTERDKNDNKFERAVAGIRLREMAAKIDANWREWEIGQLDKGY